MRSFLITLMGSGASKLLLVASTFVCSNLLSQSLFGEFSFIRNTFNVIVAICGLNFAGICTKYATETRTDPRALARLMLVFAFSLVICVIAGTALCFLPDIILLRWFRSESIVGCLRLFAIMLPLFILNPLLEGVLRGQMRFRLIGAFQTLTSLFFLISVWVGIRLAGFNGAITALMLYYLICSAGLVPFMFRRRHIPLLRQKASEVRSELPILWAIVVPLFITSFIEAPVSWAAQFVLMRHSTYADIGSMTAIVQLKNLAILIPSYFFSTFLAFAGKMNAERDYKAYFSGFARMGRRLFLWGLLLTAALLVAGPWLLRLYGPEYGADYGAFVVSTCGILLSLFAAFWRTGLIVREYQRALLVNSICWCATWILTLILLLEFSPLTPLMAYFVSLLTAIVVQFTGIALIFYNDKRKLLAS